MKYELWRLGRSLGKDNDAGLQFRSYRADGTEALLAERPGHGLITEDWNETNWIWQKLRFEGRRLRGKYWPAHIPEPNDWAIDTEYHGVAEGRVGFRLGSGLVHIAYFAAAADDLLVPPPDYWLFPHTEAFPDTALPAFTLYTNGTARLLAARWTLAPGDRPIDAQPQRLEIAAGPHAFPVRAAKHNDGDSAVRLALAPRLLGSKMTFALRNAAGTVLAEARVRRVDTRGLRKRIAALESAVPDPASSPDAETALALLARTRRLLATSDFAAAERSLAYAEEYRGTGSPATKIAARIATRPFAPPLAAASVKTRDGKILVNGEPFIVKGVNVVMDNLRPHKAAGIRETIESVGAGVVYLPPYSPDFNPIEEMWSKLKGHLRTAGSRTFDTLCQAVATGLGKGVDQIARASSATADTLHDCATCSRSE